MVLGIYVLVIVLNAVLFVRAVFALRRKLSEEARIRYELGVLHGCLIGRSGLEVKNYYPEAWAIIDKQDAEIAWECALVGERKGKHAK